LLGISAEQVLYLLLHLAIRYTPNTLMQTYLPAARLCWFRCDWYRNLAVVNCIVQGWGTCGPRTKCGPREHLIWPASEFSLPNLEYKIASKRSYMTSRYLDSMSREPLSLIDKG